MSYKKLTIVPLAAAAAFAFTASSASAVDFKGKTIEWIVPFKEGGGSGRWARFFAPLLSKALPGSPTIAIKHVPGAGSTKGANLFQRRAKPNGLTILGTSGSTQFPYLLGDKRVKYEYKDWNVVLATPTGGVVYASPKLGVKDAAAFAKLKGKKLLYGSQGATSLDLVPLLGFELLGVKVDAIFGMKGRGSGRLAFERGETNVDYQTSSAYLSKVTPLVKEGKAVPLFSWGALDDNGNIVRDPTFPNLPHFAEVYEKVHGKKPSGAGWEAWKSFFIAGFPSQKMVFLPKGTPKPIIDAYIASIKKVITAPDFAKNAKKRLGVYPQKTGDAAKNSMKAALTVSPEAKAFVKKWLKDRYNVSL